MLVLTRKPGQSVLVGSARLTVLGVEGNKVRLGFQAPPGVRIAREEARARLQAVAGDAARVVEVTPAG